MRRRVRLGPRQAGPMLRALPPAAKRRIREALRRVAEDPLAAEGGLDVRRLDVPHGTAPLMRLRLGDWRVIYAVADDQVFVVRIFHRREGYGWMERMDRRGEAL